jgi:LmbE family N-acetylglucosaminyl deacetylase
MHGLELPLARGTTARVLAVGAHADDIEIGCGATMLALQRSHAVEVTWVVFGAEGVREDEARASAKEFLADAGSRAVVCHAFRDGYFPYVGGEIKDVFEEMKRELAPDVIFTHTRDDLHQDHRLICELTWNTWRDHLVLEYEIPKYDGDLASPNTFVPVSAELAQRKVELLEHAFVSQRDKHWFDRELFLGLMRVRGAEARARSGYAEAFFTRKVILAIGEDP